MFSSFSWLSERGCDRVVDGQRDHSMAHASRPVLEIVSGTAAKRKREASLGDMSQAHDAKRIKAMLLEKSETPEIKLEHEARTEPIPITSAPVKPSRVCEAIESQFSLEILLKHNELRLINQELAKCQVALEQLRRCHLIPYPTSQGTHESLLNIVNGTGPALDQGANVPRWAPSYGVTEGPYARHYAKWLIPDPSFDGIQYERAEVSRAGKTIPEGRSTRHSIAEGVTTTKTTSRRGVIGGQKLQALSSGYPQAKEKAGPCVLKRGDGQMVKLVCLDCHRYDFSSTQGFINHCRIAHHRDFKSHEEAAVASGQSIEIDEGGAVVGEEKPAPIANGLVHPMVRNAPMTKDALAAVMSRINASLEMHKNGDPRVPHIPTSRPSIPVVAKPSAPNFVASSSTPYLSEMMRKMGFNKDLGEIVGDARNKVDHEEEYDSEDSEGLPTSTQQHSPEGLDEASSSPQPPMRIPARAGMSPAPFGRPVSSKGMSPRPSHAMPVINTAAANLNRPVSRLITTPTMNYEAMHLHQMPEVDIEMVDGPSIIDLSPNTVTSNKPPSLVSDDGDYDDGTDADRESSGEDEDDSDVAEIDIEDDGVDKVVPLRNRGSDAMRIRKEEKHVSFVSPVKEQERRARRM